MAVAFAALLIAAAAPRAAQAQSDGSLNVGATAKVLKPLSVTRTGNGNPNNLMVGGTSLADQATFDVMGEPGAAITVKFAFPSELPIVGGGSEALPLSNFLAEYLLGSGTDGNGDPTYTFGTYIPVTGVAQNMTLVGETSLSQANQFLRFSYTASAAVGQKPGAYRGAVVVTVEYTEI